MPRGKLWRDKQLSREFNRHRHYKPSMLGPRCDVCGQLMVRALAEAEPGYHCHPCCDPAAKNRPAA